MPRVGRKLSGEVLERRAALPAKPDPVTLDGELVRLMPLDVERDAELLHVVSDGRPVRWGRRSLEEYDPDVLVWRYMPAGPFADAAGLAAYLRTLVAAPDGLCLCVTDAASCSGTPSGSATAASSGSAIR